MEPLKPTNCFTCHQEQDGGITATGASVILECSEFEIHTRKTTAVSSIARMPFSVPEHDNRGEVKGLCQNCVLISTCTWYRDDAVIFHCEHYQ